MAKNPWYVNFKKRKKAASGRGSEFGHAMATAMLSTVHENITARKEAEREEQKERIKQEAELGKMAFSSLFKAAESGEMPDSLDFGLDTTTPSGQMTAKILRMVNSAAINRREFEAAKEKPIPEGFVPQSVTREGVRYALPETEKPVTPTERRLGEREQYSYIKDEEAAAAKNIKNFEKKIESLKEDWANSDLWEKYKIDDPEELENYLKQTAVPLNLLKLSSRKNVGKTIYETLSPKEKKTLNDFIAEKRSLKGALSAYEERKKRADAELQRIRNEKFSAGKSIRTLKLEIPEDAW